MSGLPGRKKLKMPNLATNKFQKGQILNNKKAMLRPRFKVKISLHIANFAQFSPKLASNGLFSSTLKKGQMAKSFYFWQTISKRSNLDDLAL